jgi:hypothetical protein
MIGTLWTAAFALSAASQLPAQASQVTDSSFACSLAVAAKVDLRTLAKSPENWKGKCIAVDGFLFYRALFAEERDARHRAPMTNQRLKSKRVGLYGADDLDTTSAPPYTAVGVVGLCEALWESSLLVLGYCHWSGGPFLDVVEMHRR